MVFLLFDQYALQHNQPLNALRPGPAARTCQYHIMKQLHRNRVGHRSKYDLYCYKPQDIPFGNNIDSELPVTQHWLTTLIVFYVAICWSQVV